MPAPRTICLITPSHLANNPRVVKEATALSAAGFSVQIVCGRIVTDLIPTDVTLASNHGLSVSYADYRRRPGTLPSELLSRLARMLLRFARQPALALAARAEHRAFPFLVHAARSIPARFYLGHTPAGLCAAWSAARHNQGALGFDAEDFHAAETQSILASASARRGLDRIERSLLRVCTHVTAASPLIADAYVSAYGVEKPVTVLNVFSQSLAPSAPIASARPRGLPRLYWFSQTVGPGRGLEKLVVLMARMTTTCDLILRGSPVAGFVESLYSLARSAGWAGEIEILPRAAPDEMVRLASPHDLGLALELPTPRNRDLCLTNKLFTYLLAGVPVAYTPTRAQKELAHELGHAGICVDLEDPQASARRLDDYFSRPGSQAAARRHAWTLGQTRYNWEAEQHVLCASVERALSRAPAPSRIV